MSRKIILEDGCWFDYKDVQMHNRFYELLDKGYTGQRAKEIIDKEFKDDKLEEVL